jgi:hypothetical protein
MLGRPLMELLGSWQHEAATDQQYGWDCFIKVKWTTEGGKTGAPRIWSPDSVNHSGQRAYLRSLPGPVIDYWPPITGYFAWASVS